MACSGPPAPPDSPVPVDHSPVAAGESDRFAAPTPPARTHAAPSAGQLSAARPDANEPAPAPRRPVPVYREVVIPAGTVIGVALASPIASDTSRNEDVVRAALRDDVTLEDGTMLEAGSEV